MNERQTHYHLLQIQPDADPEIVDAAYRRLCKKHHPDLNPGAESEERIRLLNAAYRVLGDPAKRRQYDEQIRGSRMPEGAAERRAGAGATAERRAGAGATAGSTAGRPAGSNSGSTAGRPSAGSGKWERSASQASRFSRGDGGGGRMQQEAARTTEAARTAEAAAEILSKWFDALREQQWHRAWQLISDADRRRVPKEEFIDWQEAVSELYRLGDVDVTVFRTHADESGPVRVDLIAEGFEIDLMENAIREMKTVKTVAWNGSSWQVLLAYEDVRGLTAKFRLMAESRNVRILDQGALGEMLRQEAYRAKRFSDPLSIAALRLVPPPGHEEVIGMWEAKALNWMSRSAGRMRMSDMLARLDDGLFLFILPNTNADQAEKALRKVEATLSGLADSEGSSLGFRSRVEEFDGRDEAAWIRQMLRRMGEEGV